MNEYDLIIIGGGAAGLTAAAMGNQLAAKTLLVERSRLGGDCTWHGCVPSKALLKAARVAHLARSAGRYGLEPAELGVDLARVMGRVHEIQEHIYQHGDQPAIYESLGAEVKHAAARFTGTHTLALIRTGQPAEHMHFRTAIIATGSRPAIPAIPGLSSIPYLTNETIFNLERLPPRLAVIGGGPVGVEMAQAFQRLGSQVTLLQHGAHLLPKDDPEITAVLRERLEAEGISIRTQTSVTGVQPDGQAIRMLIQAPTGQESIDADAVLVATGRRANTEDLALDAAGVLTNDGYILADAHCRTSRKYIYACGDVTGGLQFTHVAEHEAKVAVANALTALPLRVDRAAIPWVTFTDPEVAHVGARRQDLVKQGRRFKLYRFPYSKIDRAVMQGAPHGWIHILATPVTGYVLGASIVGEGAGEMLGELGLALRHRIPLRKIADTIHAYPTQGLGVRRAADQWYVQNMWPVLVTVNKMLHGLRGAVPAAPSPEKIV